MNNGLIAILSIIGLLVLYWVIWGQRSYQKMLAGEQVQKIEGEISRIESKPKSSKRKAKP